MTQLARQILPLGALLLGATFLLFAGGINGLLLPVRGAAEGFSPLTLGLLGTGWAIGYVAGCLVVPRLVAGVGHVRAFGVMAAMAAVAVLASLLMIHPAAWIGLRAFSGFAFAGAAMIVESWLGEQAEPGSRGKIYGAYTTINLVASTAGTMALTLGDGGAGHAFFVVTAIFYVLALLPTAVSTGRCPKPLVSVRLDLGALWRNSPVAVGGAFLVGISNSAFGTLAAVYAQDVGLGLGSVALFLSIPVLASAAVQLPVGMLSDRTDRRRVLCALAVVAVAADLAFLLLRPEDRATNLALAGLLGAAIFTMYPVLLAHANDHAAPDATIQTSGGLLLVFGVAAIVGPLLAGLAMGLGGAVGLFGVTVAAHATLALFSGWRMFRSAPVPEADKLQFRPTLSARISTPETAALAGEGAPVEEPGLAAAA